MKIRKLLVGLTAAALAASGMAISASAATKLSDVADPSEEDKEKNDAYYSIGGMAFYMNNTWSWNQGDWVGISDDGKIEISYSINEVLTDTTMSGKGNLGSMGVMVMNLPEDGYPYEIKVSDAKFEAKDGTVTELTSVNAITEADLNPEGGFRIIIRPTDEIDEDTGEVKTAATPEVAGWDEEGAFSGGTLSMTLDFGAPASNGDTSSKADNGSSTKANDTAKTDASSSDSNKDTSKDTSSNTNANNGGTAKTTTASSAADAADSPNAETGAGEFAFAGLSLAAAALVVTKRNK